VQWYESEVTAIEQLQQRSPAPPSPIVFYGSSSIRLWDSLADDFPGLPVVNRGFGGATMAACSWFFGRLVRPLAPRSVVLYAGDNDLSDGATPENVLAQLDRLNHQLDADCGPGTRLALLSVKVSPARLHLAPRISELNLGLQAAVKGRPNSVWIDVAGVLMSSDRPDPQFFQGDGLHLNPSGYEAWTGVIRGFLPQIT